MDSGGGRSVHYAIIGDIHSSKKDLEEVLKQIQAEAPQAILIGTGDIFECTISKKDITDRKFTSLSEVMQNPMGFSELLTFQTVRGNQEERILQITETDDPIRSKLLEMPETISINNAQIIHGHQWKWGGEPWALQEASVNHRLVFFGHSHLSALSIDGIWQHIDWNQPYDVSSGEVLVNVGAVIHDREWVLYDAEKQTVTFLKV